MPSDVTGRILQDKTVLKNQIHLDRRRGAMNRN